MDNNGGHRGVSGKIEMTFAIPTDDPLRWRMKNGALVYRTGFLASIELEGGYIPQFKSSHGLTVTYCTFTAIRQEANRTTGDVAMMTCVDGRALDSRDIASNVEVIELQEFAASLAEKGRSTPAQS